MQRSLKNFHQRMKIQKLPEEAILKLQSGLVITDAVQCVLELVHNSLDADATGIAVRIDLKNYQIKVIDNGKGIRREDLELIGEKFMTSKYHGHDMNSTFPTYGFKGQALSCILDVCKLLTIESKSEEHGPAFTKMFQYKKPSIVTECNSERRGTGTTVTVDDFMYSMPVRRKRMNEVFDLEEIKTQLQYLAIIHYNVCFTLRNENKGVIVLQTPQASSTLEAISNIFGKTVAKSLKPIDYNEKEIKITGFMSLLPQFQNKIQLLYVNKRIIAKGMTHKFINNVMKEYIGKNSQPFDGQFAKNFKTHTHNIFLIEIECSNSHCDLITNIRETTVEFKNWEKVFKCLHKGIKKTFREVLNLDSSSNTPEKENEKILKKRKFGTSVLQNAIKGNPVKRKFSKNEQKKKKKQKISHNSPGKKLKNASLQCSQQNKQKDDSMESPIPKKKYKSIQNANYNSEKFNQSYFEFYDWLKKKIKIDKNALNLYNDFLQFKNDLPLAEFNSPVVGGKLKGKTTNPVKINRKRNKFENFSNLNEEIRTHQTENIPCGRLRLQKNVEFSPEKWNFLEKTSKLKKQFVVPILNKFSRQFEFNETVFSIPSSEKQLNTVIDFRNWSEGFFQQESITHDAEIPQEYTVTWASHYRGELPENLQFFGEKSPGKNLVACDKTRENSIPRNFESSKRFKIAKSCQDVEVQVEIDQNQPERENAIVQTSPTDFILPVTPIFKTKEKISNESEINFEKSGEFVQVPDFWNVSPESRHLESFTHLTVGKNSTGNDEFHCGQKTNRKNETIASKETQNLSQMWGDSLIEIINRPSENDSNLKSIETLPKTIPLEEIDLIKPIESIFSLTERHEFIPKGLSPSCLNVESSKTFSLSPSEKTRLEKTVESSRNDFLARVKWENESTGGHVKPTFPDGILDEIRIKSGRNSIGRENGILAGNLSYCAVKVQSLLHSFAFTKEIFSSVEILGQLDKKFIVTRMKLSTPKKMELISLFDQHAVDERIKLEELLKDYSSADGKFLKSCLNPPLECTIDESDVRFLSDSDSEEKLSNFGLNMKIVNENTISFKEIPKIIFDKHEKDMKSKKNVILSDVLKVLIVSIVDEIREMKGASSKIPKILHNALCLEACHKAIKFNKKLSLEKMNEMIKKLKNCKLPFQCAHGRPSVIPIIDLEDFQSSTNDNEMKTMEKIKKFHDKTKPNTDNL